MKFIVKLIILVPGSRCYYRLNYLSSVKASKLPVMKSPWKSFKDTGRTHTPTIGGDLKGCSDRGKADSCGLGPTFLL